MKFKLLALFLLILTTSVAVRFLLLEGSPLDDYELHRALVDNPMDQSKKVEYIWVEPAIGRPWPVLIYVHGYQAEKRKIGARIFYNAKVLQRMAERGVLAVAVSMPGYGYSTGRPDFSGPLSQAALAEVIKEIHARDDIRQDKIALIGFSRGAVVVANVAAEDRTLAGAILMSGVYDFPKMIAKWKALGTADSRWLLKDFSEEAGMTNEAMRDRSVIKKEHELSVPILAIHGADDKITDPADAEEIVADLNKRKIPSKLVVFPRWKHAIADFVSQGEINSFLNQVLR